MTAVVTEPARTGSDGGQAYELAAGSRQLVAGPGYLVTASYRGDGSGGPVRFTIRDGQGSAGNVLVRADDTPAGYANWDYSQQKRGFADGLWLELESGGGTLELGWAVRHLP